MFNKIGCSLLINMPKILYSSNVGLFLNTLLHVQTNIFLGYFIFAKIKFLVIQTPFDIYVSSADDQTVNISTAVSFLSHPLISNIEVNKIRTTNITHNLKRLLCSLTPSLSTRYATSALLLHRT
jgi:hypothetical protein